MRLLGPKFLDQTPESFWSYAKELSKHHAIKRPESSKPKTRKKKTKNGKHDDNSRLEPSSSDPRETQKDAQTI